MNDDADNIITLTADIVAAHVSNNSVAVSELPTLISSIHTALAGLGVATVPQTVKQEPAVAIRNSVKPDFIICLEDGKKMKMLKRHLMTVYGMTPADYRAKWELPASYPMVCPNYAEMRRSLAIRVGLGRKPGKRSTKQSASKRPAK
jgi:predicted transcriptional regulator